MNELCEQDGHIGKILEFTYKLVDGDVVEHPSKYGCTRCPATSKKLWQGFGEYTIRKEPCKDDCNCFGCKVKTLQMNAGDATRDIPDKKWTSELNEYKKARAEGIQPGGTTRAHIEAARKASENMGKAYNSETMAPAHQIDKKVATTMKELGI